MRPIRRLPATPPLSCGATRPRWRKRCTRARAPEGVEQEVRDRTFALTLGRPVRFRLFAASGYRADKPGDLVPIEDELAELPPLQTVVQGEGAAQVRLHAALTEIGTLELWCAT